VISADLLENIHPGIVFPAFAGHFLVESPIDIFALLTPAKDKLKK
jgi:hypothetical protein